MRTALGLEQYSFEEFLASFKARCWYVDDLIIGRSVSAIEDDKERSGLCRAARGDLAERIRRYRPGAVVSLLRSIEDIVEDATSAAAPDAKFYSVPFPGIWQRPRFIAAMQRIIPELPRDD